MNSIDTAWVAGIVEGEGCMGLDTFEVGRGRTNPKAYIKVSMTDEDVIRAIHQKTSVGNVFGPYPGGGSKGKDYWKEHWVWHVTKRDDVHSIITDVLPYLYSRRTIQAMICLEAIEQLNSAAEHKRNFCPNNHPKTGNWADTEGHCLSCRRQKYYEMKVS